MARSSGTLTASTKTTPDQQTALFAAGGARIGAEIPVWRPHLFLRLSADLLLGRPVGLSRNEQPVWQGGLVTGGVGAGLGTAF